MPAKSHWHLWIGVFIIVFHGWLGFSMHRLMKVMLAEKAELFLDSLAASTDQTLQASHYLEERIVSRLKAIAGEIAAAPAERLTQAWLETLRQQNELKGITVYNCHGKVKTAHDASLVGTEMPATFACHDLIQGKKSEHIFGFSTGIFCETDTFGYSLRLANGDVLRLLTGVDFVLGFEKNVGLPSLLARFKQHPGIGRLDLVDSRGISLLKNPVVAARSMEGYEASRTFMLHGASLGRFEVTLQDQSLADLRKTGFLAIFVSCLFALTGLNLFRVWILRREEHQEQTRHIQETKRRIDGLGRVVAAVAHEVRNPLNTLTLGLNALRSDVTEGVPTTALETRLDLLEKTVMQANQMIQNLLQSSRPILPHKRTVNFSEWLTSLTQAFQSTSSGLSLRWTGEPLAELSVDPDLLQRLIWNLLLNAQQAGAKEILLSGKKDEAGTALEINDNGRGIPQDVFDNLFVPGNTNRPEGSGMGLYNCQRICTALGGRIHAVSEPGSTSFHLYFPAEQGDRPA